MRIPADREFIRAVAKQMCLAKGDSWVSDDSAQDIYSNDAQKYITVINKQLALRALAKEKEYRPHAAPRKT